MMAITHAVISSSVTSLVLGKTDTLTLGLSIIGSQLPDLDSSKSIIGQIFFPISRYLENNFPHRSITHSLIATAVPLLRSPSSWDIITLMIFIS